MLIPSDEYNTNPKKSVRTTPDTNDINVLITGINLQIKTALLPYFLE